MSLDISLILFSLGVRYLWTFTVANSSVDETAVFFQHLEYFQPPAVVATISLIAFRASKASFKAHDPVRNVQVAFDFSQRAFALQDIPVVEWIPEDTSSMSLVHNRNA